MWSTHELITLTKFHYDSVKIVDFLLIANFDPCLDFYATPSIWSDPLKLHKLNSHNAGNNCSTALFCIKILMEEFLYAPIIHCKSVARKDGRNRGSFCWKSWSIFSGFCIIKNLFDCSCNPAFTFSFQLYISWIQLFFMKKQDFQNHDRKH